MALLVKMDGSMDEIVIPEEGQLRFLQKHVAGNIEMVPVSDPNMVKRGYVYAICNEEGKINDMPVNSVATTLSGRDGSMGFRDPFAGDVIFTKEGEVD